MRRILFVDDEPKILEGLQRMLRVQRHHWEMAFANGGEAALAMLEAAPFDVIVSDMRMPGMDGAVLLTRVREKYPDVVRIVLSGYFQLEAAFRAVPVAHQFLLKPCDPDRLRVAVERACSLKSTLTDEALCRMVGSMGQLPALPRTYAELTKAVQDPDVALEKIARIVERDVAISAKVLQLVNSAFFGLVHHIATVRTAVAYLGLDVVRHLVLSVEAFGVFKTGKGIEDSFLEEFESHAQLTTKIAARLPIPEHLRDATIVAALVHDVGKLVLAARLPEHLARSLKTAAQEGVPMHVVEQQSWGVTHAEIGAYLLGLWGLPTTVVEAVAHHHCPTRIPHQGFDSVAAIHVANLLAHEHGKQLRTSGPAHAVVEPGYLEELGVAGSLVDWHAMAEEAAGVLAGA